MKRFVNGDAVEFGEDTCTVTQMPDRLSVRTSDGTFSALAIRMGEKVLVSYKGRQYQVEDRISGSRASTHVASGELRAHMPGQIVDTRKSEGDVVSKGDTILVLEAMKTQQPFSAPFDGVLRKLCVAKGDQVSDGALLAVIEANHESEAK